jgi:hypothetical protein
MPSTDYKAPQTEVHSTFIKLSYQNLVIWMTVVAMAVGLYWHTVSRIDALEYNQMAQDAKLKHFESISAFHGKWLSDIGQKTGVQQPGREP